MMRKLAVTVFALSLAALGCGSDSGTKSTDSAVTPDGGKTDVYVAPAIDTGAVDAPMGPDVAVRIDTPAVDAPAVIDQALGRDTAQVIDGPKVQVDGGADSQRVDTGSVDAGSAG